MKRPHTEHNLSIVTTPLSAIMIALLGPDFSSGGVTLTRGESLSIRTLYGYREEKPTKRPKEPTPPKPPGPSAGPEDAQKYAQLRDKYDMAMVKWRKWQDPLPLMQAGAARDAIRDAHTDGFRLLAWIAKHVPPGGDPLKTLIQFAVEAGIAVSSEDFEWAETEDDGDDDERGGE